MSTPSGRMKFVHFDLPGSPEVLYLNETAQPKPAAQEVLIKVEAAGVNRPDIMQREGCYAPLPGASSILGLEVSGTITALGSGVKSFQVGDRVCALISGGGYAEYCVAPWQQCLRVPKNLTMIEAAGIPETFFTVWANVFTRGRLQKGETLLIHGGSSGIGTVAIQLAHAFGARVFVTAGSDEKCEFCLKLGADIAINYRTQDFVSEIRRLNAGQGVDVILDMVAGDYFQKNLELLAPEGRLVQIATQRGAQVNLSLLTLINKGITITGSLLRPRTVEQKGLIAAELYGKVWPLLESRKVQVIIDRTYPLAQAAEAHRYIESSNHIGKIILIVDDSDI